VQHALRAFTAKDRTTIKKTAENYPLTSFYKTDELLTSLGIGEAIVTVLNEQGHPTPLAHTLMRAPITRMDVLQANEIQALVAASSMAHKYNEVLDRESAFEILEARLKEHDEEEKEVDEAKAEKKKAKETSVIGELSKNTMARQVVNTVVREGMRGLLGVLGIKTTTRRRRRGLFG
jgi:uncharacterized protein